ncbi:hypothetical protein [Streptomyces sp. NPDC046821]|uniref:hypothetical protein n=1 Tax=Streptomyces sp. NPDC046821 TaxID=3154702 RepID=UPI0033E24DDC
MISTRRVLAAVALAAGASALAMPAAQAAPGSPLGVKPISLDDLATTGIPAEHKGEIPTVTQQLGGLNKLNELHQVTDLVAPVTNVLPSVS